MKPLTSEDKIMWLGKLTFKLHEAQDVDGMVLQQMVNNMLYGGGPELVNYYNTSHAKVREIFHEFASEIWGYLSELAEKNKQNIFEFLGKYYTGYSSYQYDYFGVLVLNTYLYHRSKEIIKNIDK